MWMNMDEREKIFYTYFGPQSQCIIKIKSRDRDANRRMYYLAKNHGRFKDVIIGLLRKQS